MNDIDHKISITSKVITILRLVEQGSSFSDACTSYGLEQDIVSNALGTGLRKLRLPATSRGATLPQHIKKLCEDFGIEQKDIPNDIYETIETIIGTFSPHLKTISTEYYLEDREIEDISKETGYIQSKILYTLEDAQNIMSRYQSTYLKKGMNYFLSENDEAIYMLNLPVWLKKKFHNENIYTLKELSEHTFQYIYMLVQQKNKYMVTLENELSIRGYKFFNDSSDDTMNLSILECPLDGAVKNALMRAQIFTVGDLILYNEKDIKAIKGIGDKAFRQIEQCLENIWLSLKGNKSDTVSDTEHICAQDIQAKRIKDNLMAMFNTVMGNDYEIPPDIIETLNCILDTVEDEERNTLIKIYRGIGTHLQLEKNGTLSKTKRAFESYLVKVFKSNYLIHGKSFYDAQNDYNIFTLNMGADIKTALYRHGIRMTSELQKIERKRLEKILHSRIYELDVALRIKGLDYAGNAS